MPTRPQYDTDTLYLAELYMSGILLQIAVDSIAEVVALTGDASKLEPFFDEITVRDWSDLVVPAGKRATPMRLQLARRMLPDRIREAIELLRKSALEVEKQRSTPN